jgi:hypothetical protein
VDDNSAFFLRLLDPLHTHDVVFSYVAAFNQKDLGVLHIEPVVRHGSAPKSSG